MRSLVLVSVAVLTLSCKSQPPKGIGVSHDPASERVTPVQFPSDAGAASSTTGDGGPAIPSGAQAQVGKPAPVFTLPDTEGNLVRLDQFKGKKVVLEWFNPECPFVKAAHTKGSLKGEAAKVAAKNVVWLAINSSAPGNQGNGVEKSVEWKNKYSLSHPVLLDPAGEVGHAYGATNTPHMFVIDEKGTLVYGGAIDNSPDGEAESPEGGRLVNYVEAALNDLTSGRPLGIRETKAYGCSVKY
ncbi:MAG: thioredoxin family protein [Polyangiaceae bacterium]